jgi:hypothetical protein
VTRTLVLATIGAMAVARLLGKALLAWIVHEYNGLQEGHRRLPDWQTVALICV